MIHAGFYYSHDTKKGKFCNKGNFLMRDYCLKNKIKTNKCGKVVVTRNKSQEEVLLDLYQRGKKNGCTLEIFDKNKLVDFEPNAITFKNFLWSPNTWSISLELFNCLINDCKNLDIKFIQGKNYFK